MAKRALHAVVHAKMEIPDRGSVIQSNVGKNQVTPGILTRRSRAQLLTGIFAMGVLRQPKVMDVPKVVMIFHVSATKGGMDHNAYLLAIP